MPTNEAVPLMVFTFARIPGASGAYLSSTSDQSVRCVFNTHQHDDHTGGNKALLASSEIIIQKNGLAKSLPEKCETQVFLGGKEVRARYLGRGHANGGVLIYFPPERVLHTGDLGVTTGGPPFIDYSYQSANQI